MERTLLILNDLPEFLDTPCWNLTSCSLITINLHGSLANYAVRDQNYIGSPRPRITTEITRVSILTSCIISSKCEVLFNIEVNLSQKPKNSNEYEKLSWWLFCRPFSLILCHIFCSTDTWCNCWLRHVETYFLRSASRWGSRQ